MDQKDFITLPKTVMVLADEIKRAVDAYWNRELQEAELKELLWKWAGTRKLLKGSTYNKTIAKLCGKARMEVVEKLLEGYQNRI